MCPRSCRRLLTPDVSRAKHGTFETSKSTGACPIWGAWSDRTVLNTAVHGKPALAMCIHGWTAQACTDRFAKQAQTTCPAVCHGHYKNACREAWRCRHRRASSIMWACTLGQFRCRMLSRCIWLRSTHSSTDSSAAQLPGPSCSRPATFDQPALQYLASATSTGVGCQAAGPAPWLRNARKGR